MCYRPGKLVLPASRSFQCLEYLRDGAEAGSGTSSACSEPQLPQPQGMKDPTQPLFSCHIQSECTYLALDVCFSSSILRVPPPNPPLSCYLPVGAPPCYRAAAWKALTHPHPLHRTRHREKSVCCSSVRTPPIPSC